MAVKKFFVCEGPSRGAVNVEMMVTTNYKTLRPI